MLAHFPLTNLLVLDPVVQTCSLDGVEPKAILLNNIRLAATISLTNIVNKQKSSSFTQIFTFQCTQGN